LESFWWPSLEALKDLTVEDAEEGFTLIAPDGTECAEWLAYWNQSPEHIELFTKEFINAIKNSLDSILEENGQTKKLTDRDYEDR